MEDAAPDVVAIGEVLWDVYPAEQHLGGAPFNFAAHCCQLSAQSAIVSRVGDDDLGDAILARAQAIGVDHSLIQRDEAHPTGQVLVTLHAGGQPVYDIRLGAAYDYLEPVPEVSDRLAGADVVCFGTLAQRHSVSRATIGELLDGARGALRVCDLNLRAPHYTVDVVRSSVQRSDVLKLNDDELRILQSMLGREDWAEDRFLLHLIDAYGIALVCVTLGARGCLLRTADERVEAPGYRCQVVDTVGSGDAFAAALVLHYIARSPLDEVADFANLVGAYVATQPGAIPVLTSERLAAFAAQARQVAP